jgi:hypothetical protein
LNLPLAGDPASRVALRADSSVGAVRAPRCSASGTAAATGVKRCSTRAPSCALHWARPAPLYREGQSRLCLVDEWSGKRGIVQPLPQEHSFATARTLLAGSRRRWGARLVPPWQPIRCEPTRRPPSSMNCRPTRSAIRARLARKPPDWSRSVLIGAFWRARPRSPTSIETRSRFGNPGGATALAAPPSKQRVAGSSPAGGIWSAAKDPT